MKTFESEGQRYRKLQDAIDEFCRPFADWSDFICLVASYLSLDAKEELFRCLTPERSNWEHRIERREYHIALVLRAQSQPDAAGLWLLIDEAEFGALPLELRRSMRHMIVSAPGGRFPVMEEGATAEGLEAIQ